MWASISLLAILVVKTHSITNSELINCRFQEYGITPYIVPVSPRYIFTIIYGPYRANLGNTLSVCATNPRPRVSWPNANRNLLYTVITLDVDGVLPINGTRQIVLNLVINVPGSNIRQGDRIVPRIPPNPLPGTGYHRYVSLAYRQPGRIEVTTDLFISLATNQYRNFDLAAFVARYKLGNPVAGNFYQVRQTTYVSQCDDSTYYDSCCGDSCGSQGQCGSNTNQCGSSINQCGSSTCTSCR